MTKSTRGLFNIYSYLRNTLAFNIIQLSATADEQLWQNTSGEALNKG